MDFMRGIINVLLLISPFWTWVILKISEVS